MFREMLNRDRSGAGNKEDRSLQNQHRTMALSLAGVVIVMIGLSFAAVPAYKLFCQVTGYGGTTQKAERPAEFISDRTMTIRFDSNVSHDLSWEFKPVQKVIKVRIGEPTLIFYQAKNTSKRDTVGTATFNVTPEGAGIYFNKVQCFCFDEQRLAAGQVADMPVDFYIDPAILDDKDAKRIKEVTLSYTMFPIEESAGQTVKESILVKQTGSDRSGSGT